MLKRISIIVMSFLMFSVLLPTIIHADNAEVLPKGVTAPILNAKFYFPVDERYDDNGDTEDLAADFNGKLDSSVFPDLNLVEIGFGMPAGSATVGNSVVSMEYDFNLFDFYINHGITDRLSVGAKIPYWYVKNDVNAELDSSSATVGKNPLVPGGVAPLAVPGTVPFTTDDVQNMLVQDYGYKRIESWSGSGFVDIELGARYQYLRNDSWRLAFTGGVRLPTGEIDDPDNLMDYPLGTGAWAFLFRSNNDYTGIKNTVLNATLKYDLYLPNKEVLRVPDDVNQPITPNKEEVDRNIGDIIEINTSATYQFLKGSSVYLEYMYANKFKNHISGNRGFAYDQLEAETDRVEHVFKVGLSYSTIPLFQEKKFFLPLKAHILYRDRFAGKNVLKSQYIELGIAVYF